MYNVPRKSDDDSEDARKRTQRAASTAGSIRGPSNQPRPHLAHESLHYEKPCSRIWALRKTSTLSPLNPLDQKSLRNPRCQNECGTCLPLVQEKLGTSDGLPGASAAPRRCRSVDPDRLLAPALDIADKARVSCTEAHRFDRPLLVGLKRTPICKQHSAPHSRLPSSSCTHS